MTITRFLLALPLAVQSALAGDSRATDPKAFNPFDVVSVCPIAANGRSWAVAWHPGADGPNQASARVFRYLQGPDVDECLTLMVESDKETDDAVETFAKNPTVELGFKAAKAVQRRWTLYGVDQAITEVAASGNRGAKVARMLAACEDIRVPKQTGGISEQGR
jgi:hypothetical protein